MFCSVKMATTGNDLDKDKYKYNTCILYDLSLEEDPFFGYRCNNPSSLELPLIEKSRLTPIISNVMDDESGINESLVHCCIFMKVNKDVTQTNLEKFVDILNNKFNSGNSYECLVKEIPPRLINAMVVQSKPSTYRSRSKQIKVGKISLTSCSESEGTIVEKTSTSFLDNEKIEVARSSLKRKSENTESTTVKKCKFTYDRKPNIKKSLFEQKKHFEDTEESDDDSDVFMTINNSPPQSTSCFEPLNNNDDEKSNQNDGSNLITLDPSIEVSDTELVSELVPELKCNCKKDNLEERMQNIESQVKENNEMLSEILSLLKDKTAQPINNNSFNDLTRSHSLSSGSSEDELLPMGSYDDLLKFRDPEFRANTIRFIIPRITKKDWKLRAKGILDMCVDRDLQSKILFSSKKGNNFIRLPNGERAKKIVPIEFENFIKEVWTIQPIGNITTEEVFKYLRARLRIVYISTTYKEKKNSSN